MKCTVCGQECFDETYPEVVFKDEKYCICEECSIDYEEVNGKVQYRQDLEAEGCCEEFAEMTVLSCPKCNGSKIEKDEDEKNNKHYNWFTCKDCNKNFIVKK